MADETKREPAAKAAEPVDPFKPPVYAAPNPPGPMVENLSHMRRRFREMGFDKSKMSKPTK